MTADTLQTRLERMLASGQDTPLLRFSLGGEYLRAGEFALARSHLQAAVEQKPDYSAAWKLLGKACAEAGDSAEAIRVFMRGIEVAEKHGDVQAAKEMQVFLKRLRKSAADGGDERG